MPKSTKPIEHLLRLLEKQDWNALTLAQIQKATKTKLTSKNELLPLVIAYVTERTAAKIRLDKEAAPHDRLFDVMMTRFETLQTHRKAFLNLIAAARKDPALARYILPAEAEAAKTMLTLASLKQTGPKEILSTTGLLVVYGLTLCVWERDETKDLSKTMSTLDRNLRRAGKLAEILFQRI